MICPNCHAAMPDRNRFCTRCGTALTTTGRPRMNAAPGTSDTTIPVPARPGPNRLIVALATLLVVLIAAAITLFATYRLEIWGGKTLPSPDAIARQVASRTGGGADGKVQAKDVTEALKLKGLNAETVPVFSGEERGTFLGYDGMTQGQRVAAGSTVKVRESAGPGVPEDTIGKSVTDVTDTFAGMGVPVHYKNVVISDDSTIPEGQVAVTHPAPSTGLTDDDKDDGIYIGVASKGEGIPVDVLGMDKDKAVSSLESQGYDVDLEPHYSSKQYVGKISGSYPGPGSTLDSGEKVTLYYGVDKSSNMDMLTKTTGGYTVADMNAIPMIGMYCKSRVVDTSKDCITLEQANGPFGDETEAGSYLQIKGREPADRFDVLGLTNFSQDISGALVKPYGVMAEHELPMRNHLLLKDWGMFELYAGMDLRDCGGTVMANSTGEYCVDGKYYQATYNEDAQGPDLPAGVDAGQSPTGTTFRMKDFLVYFPVGADAKSLEDSDYFDSEALAQAKKQKAVDTSRPFILMRDTSQYDKTEVSADDFSTVDPFVPTNSSLNGYTNKMVKMKPAPSDATVYYLVEQNGDLDWSAMPDAGV